MKPDIQMVVDDLSFKAKGFSCYGVEVEVFSGHALHGGPGFTEVDELFIVGQEGCAFVLQVIPGEVAVQEGSFRLRVRDFCVLCKTLEFFFPAVTDSLDQGRVTKVGK